MTRTILNHSRIGCIAALALGLGGCFLVGERDSGDGDGFGDDATIDDDDVDDDGDEPAEGPLAECRGEASDAEVEDNVSITEEYANSLHEMVACGGLTVLLCSSVIDGVISAIINENPDATPAGWSYAGEGVHVTGADGVSMETRFYVTEDYEFAARGELVRANLFLVDSYLVDARLVIDWSTGAAELQYDEPGPLVELLGFGAEPPNPLPVDYNDLSSLKTKLRQLEFESDVVVDDARHPSTIRYHAVIPRMSAQALVTGTPMIYDLVEVDGSRDDLDQRLIVDSWSIDFIDDGSILGGGGELDGESEFRVVGGHFDYAGTAVFDHSKWPEMTLRCP